MRSKITLCPCLQSPPQPLSLGCRRHTRFFTAVTSATTRSLQKKTQAIIKITFHVEFINISVCTAVCALHTPVVCPECIGTLVCVRVDVDVGVYAPLV